LEYRFDLTYIGILTYELIFGRVPFEIRTEDDLVKVIDEDIYFSKGIPLSNEAKDFILNCLHKNPKERPPMSKLVDHSFIHRNAHKQ
jgi:serine/threonine protein kinase